MMPGIADKQIDTDGIVGLVSRYFQVDGYYTRRREINVRCASTVGTPDGTGALEAELRLRGYQLKSFRRGDSLHLNIYPAARGLPWLNIILFLVTTVSVSIIPGYLIEGSRFFHDSALVVKWLHFSVPLLLILLFHEFGHYFAARRAGVRASLPYFLPFPNIIGTFGAFIKMKSPIPNRRDLIAIGAAGPLAGLVLAIVVLGVGLANISYQPVPHNADVSQLVEPLILRVVSFFVASDPAPQGYAVSLWDNQILFAAWMGLVVTMLNLLPVGQLDGGHIIYALFPRRHSLISRGIFVLLLGAGFLWEGWWFWAILLFVFIRFGHPPTLDDSAPLGVGSRLLGWAAILAFILTFTPVPF